MLCHNTDIYDCKSNSVFMTPTESVILKNYLNNWENAIQFYLAMMCASNVCCWVSSSCLGKISDGIKMRKVFQPLKCVYSRLMFYIAVLRHCLSNHFQIGHYSWQVVPFILPISLDDIIYLFV